MRTWVAHALRFANTSWTRRTELSVNPQFTTYQPRNSVQTTGATASNLTVVDMPRRLGLLSREKHNDGHPRYDSV